MSERLRGILLRHAALFWTLLGISVAVRMVLELVLPNGFDLIDLHVYVDGSASLSGGGLYSFAYDGASADFPLPFTYPPFAAFVFYPLHWLPFTLVVIVWQLLTIAALYGVVRLSQQLLWGTAATGPELRVAAALWTGVAMWMEPVRATLDFGQVNMFLVLALMWAVKSTRWWVSGLLVGLTAGIKLTPAITGMYFLARGQWRVVISSALAFGATVLLGWALIGDQARSYFTDLLGDTARVGPIGSVNNQSLRGALSRLAGHDVGSTAVFAVAMLVAAVLCVLAWRAIDAEDRLGQLLIVQFFGLLASPISWEHHWVWVVPLLIWLVHGPLWSKLGTKILCGLWALSMFVGVSTVLFRVQPDPLEFSRPAYLAWLGTVNALLTLSTLVWVALTGRRRSSLPAGPEAVAAPRGGQANAEPQAG
ncbi:mannosyltransferase [Tomitella biformata]|uniref:mannosyltransferase n=1 Tax=Tomitella biformata TaxID=630403 RepID=UPI0004632C10|nr:mannosyltransferase [Tomitella biformata]